jgi:uncharacterized membrane protein (DUF485 family)
MKLIANQIKNLKALYQKNKLLGILLGVGICCLCIIFSPELLVFFAPQWIFKRIWGLSVNMFFKVALLTVSFLFLLFVIYCLFNIIHGIFDMLTHLIK